MKKILLALILSISVLIPVGASSPAQASDFHPHFGEVGWWNTKDTGGSIYTHWTYTNYPVPCNEEPEGAAWEVIWAYKAGESSTIPSLARNSVNRAGSIFAASAKQRVSTWAQVRNNSYAPRWETSGTGDGNCVIQFNKAAIPANIWPNDAYESNSPYYSEGTNGMITYIVNTLGANEPNRKYLIIRANENQSHANWAGWAGYSHDNRPGPENDNNGTSWAYIPYFDGSGQTIAHEMTHAMGALNWQMPHYNTLNSGHASDCGDIMCYEQNGTYPEGQNWGVCSTAAEFNNLTTKWQARLDCNGDDYFNPGAAWASTRWAVHNSAYLWNPPASQPANFPTGSPSARAN